MCCLDNFCVPSPCTSTAVERTVREEKVKGKFYISMNVDCKSIQDSIETGTWFTSVLLHKYKSFFHLLRFHCLLAIEMNHITFSKNACITALYLSIYYEIILCTECTVHDQCWSSYRRLKNAYAHNKHLKRTQVEIYLKCQTTNIAYFTGLLIHLRRNDGSECSTFFYCGILFFFITNKYIRRSTRNVFACVFMALCAYVHVHDAN